MARLARAVAPGVPHHITQRGNRRQQVFFNAEDYAYYLAELAVQCRSEGVETLAYCLMPNHVHLVLVPASEGALSAALSRLHRDYARRINFREGWRGYLWQGRFASFAMDEDYLLACARYVELNPVREIRGHVTNSNDAGRSVSRGPARNIVAAPILRSSLNVSANSNHCRQHRPKSRRRRASEQGG